MLIVFVYINLIKSLFVEMYAIIYFDFDRQKKSITPFKIYKNLRFDFGKDGSFLFFNCRCILNTLNVIHLFS